MGDDGAATCARAAAAAAVFASVVVRAVVVATFLRTLDLGTSFLHADDPGAARSGPGQPAGDGCCRQFDQYCCTDMAAIDPWCGRPLRRPVRSPGPYA